MFLLAQFDAKMRNKQDWKVFQSQVHCRKSFYHLISEASRPQVGHTQAGQALWHINK